MVALQVIQEIIMIICMAIVAIILGYAIASNGFKKKLETYKEDELRRYREIKRDINAVDGRVTGVQISMIERYGDDAK